MPKHPPLPLFVTDWNADTAHLSHEGAGIYVRLLCLMWIAPECRIPDDDKWLAARLHSPLDFITETVRPVVEEFCSAKSGFLSQKRLKKEWNLTRKTSDRARRAANARWHKDNLDADASLEHIPDGMPNGMPNPCPADASIEERKKEEEEEKEESNHHQASLTTPRATDKKKLGGGEDLGLELIAEFDRQRVAVFGTEKARAAMANPIPRTSDLRAATAIIAAGATLETARPVFRQVFERQLAAGDDPAGSLAYMTAAVERAICEPKLKPETAANGPNLKTVPQHRLDTPEGRASDFYAELDAGVAEPFWTQSWGPRPPVPRPA